VDEASVRSFRPAEKQFLLENDNPSKIRALYQVFRLEIDREPRWAGIGCSQMEGVYHSKLIEIGHEVKRGIYHHFRRALRELMP
jgi:hypothetical protein